MMILALESSALAASVALLEGDTLVASAYQRSGLTHSATLLPMADDLLRRCGHRLSDVDLFAVSHGPGSFTGLRIGIATVKGLAYGGDKPAIGVSTLEAMAYNLPSRDGVVCACMDARVGQVYNALFRLENGVVTRLCDDRAIKVDDLRQELDTYSGEPIWLVGDGAVLVKDKLAELPLQLTEENLRHQNAYGVARLAQNVYLAGESGDPAALVPHYLRLPQAERERLEKMKEKV